MFRFPLLAPLIVVLASSAVFAQDRGAVERQLDERYGDSTSFLAAFEALQSAVALKDAETVAALVNYPLRTHFDGEPRVITDAGAFVAVYDDLITEEIAATITGQSFSELGVEDDRVVFDGGTVWMRSYCTDRSCEAIYWLIRGLDPDS